MQLLVAQTDVAVPLDWRLRWNWNWPLWLTVLVGVAALIWVVTIYSRENATASRRMRIFLSILRLIALALVLLMFAQPTIEWFHIQQPRLALLVDLSASMETQDRDENTAAEVSRLQALQKLLTSGEQPLLDQLQADYQLELITFNQQIERLAKPGQSLQEKLQSFSTNSTSAGTRLGDAIDYVLRELPGIAPSALVLLTDGISTHGQTLEQAVARARRLRVPLYTVAIGSERLRPDVAVENLLVEEIVFPGDRLQVEATVRAIGFAGKQVEAVLRDANLEDKASVDLARTTFKLPEDGESEVVRLAIRPDKPGTVQLELAIEPLAEEVNTENNVARQTVDVRDQKIHVLLVQSQPSYEYRALKSLLERDPAVQLHVHLQEADADYPTIDNIAIKSFPANEKELFAYDVLLLGDADFGLLPRSVWPLIERFVSVHGGGMVGIAGPRFMPLAYRNERALERLLPLQLRKLNPLRSQISANDSFAFYPTALGWRTPSLQLGETSTESQRVWQALPPVSWLLRVEDVKPGAQVLAEHPEITNQQGQRLPVILRHYVGAGEVLFHATDETWRWRWRTDDRYFARYWGQVIRRLGRGRLLAGRQGVQLTADRSLYEPGEPVQLQARFRDPAQAPAKDDQVVVRLQATTGPPQQVALQRRLGQRGLFTARVENLPASEYEVLLIQPSVEETAVPVRFEIRQPLRELAEIRVNRQGLSEAAEMSGGKFYTITNASQLIQDLPKLRQQSFNALPPDKLWNSHAIMAIFVLILTNEWLLRRKYGML